MQCMYTFSGYEQPFYVSTTSFSPDNGLTNTDSSRNEEPEKDVSEIHRPGHDNRHGTFHAC